MSQPLAHPGRLRRCSDPVRFQGSRCRTGTAAGVRALDPPADSIGSRVVHVSTRPRKTAQRSVTFEETKYSDSYGQQVAINNLTPVCLLAVGDSPDAGTRDLARIFCE